MFSWKRPENIPYPSVWLKFKAKDLESENLVEYRVQDLPEDRFDEAIEYMTKKFLPDEPMCRSTLLAKDQVSVYEIHYLWRLMLKQKIVLVCFKEGSDEIVGMNMVGITTKEEKEASSKYVPTGLPWKSVYRAVEFLGEACNVFKIYNVDRYMTAFGLSVDAKYRGRGIGEYILKARVPLAKAIDCPLTSTVFTAIASQKLAYKAGFELNYEIKY